MHDWNRRTLRPQSSLSFAGFTWVILSLCLAISFAPHSYAGSILREVYQGIPGNFVSDMTNNPIYPNSPTQTNFVTDLFESPTNFDDNYGQRMHGYIVPPLTGNYTFWIATDDNGVLFLSTDDNPANAQVICYEPNWSGSRVWNADPAQQSAPVTLQAGKAYYVAALQKEGGGGDNLAVRWLRPDGLDEGPIPATYLLPYGTSFTPPQITQQPADTTVVEGSMATFQVKVSNLDLVSYKWYKGVTVINGATGSILSYGPVTLNDEGATFSATLTNKLGSTNTTTATLHVTPDVTAPTITQVINQSSTQLLVTFSEPVDGTAATYQMTGGVTVNLSSPGSDPKTILLTTSPMTFGTSYTLTVSGVKDKAQTPNTIAPNSQITFLALEFVAQSIGGASGGITRVANGQFNLSGSGTDIGGTADQFEFAWQQRTGDFDLQVRLNDVSITDTFVHAGLMARGTLDTNSAFAAVFAGSVRSGSFFESRALAGATASIHTAIGSFPVNYPQGWLRLKRAGNVFTGYGSLDGVTWVQLGQATVTLPSTVYFGLAVSSESSTALSAAQYRDFGNTVSTATGTYTPTHEPLSPSARATGLVFSEIMYHAKANPSYVNELEFVEIYNADDIPEDLTGYQLAGGITYKFPTGYSLPPGAFVVVALDPVAIKAVYGVTNVLGPYTGKLANSGDHIQLRDGFGALKLEVTFSDSEPWPVAADGSGHSLVLARPSYGEADPRAWSASSQIGGSPGRDDLIVSNPQKEVWINEFLVNSDGTQQPFVELYNHNTTAVDVSGCYITDSATTNKFKIPSSTTIPARGYLSFTATQLGFTINGAGGVLYFVNPTATRVLDAISFGGQEAGVSTGRSPDGSATIRRLAQPTSGASNGAWKIEDLVINEIMYSPLSGNKDDQYIELYNRTASPITLTNWKLSDAVDFKFPDGAVVGPNSYLVVARNSAQILSNYTYLRATNTFGNYSGSLGSSDRIVVSKTGTFLTTNQFSQVITNNIRINTAEVSYLGGGRWTKFSNGGGSSLELTDPKADMLQPGSWADSDETQKASWTTNTFTGVLDNGMGGINPDRLYVYMLDGGECLVDEIEVIKSGTAVNSVSNGTFDSGATGWGFFGDHSRTTVDSTAGLNGSGALHLRADDKGLPGVNTVRAVLTGLASGNTATLRVKTRWLAGSPEMLLRVHGGYIELPVRMSVPANLGTPGLPNSRLAPAQNGGPAIYDVSHAPILPQAGQSVVVTCKVSDPDGIGSVVLKYRVDPSTTQTSVTMRDDGTGGDKIAGDGIYSGTIPAQASGAVVGFKITAADAAGTPVAATFPNGNMWWVALPSSECYVRWGDVLPSGTFTFYYLWDTQASEAQRNNAMNNTYRDATLVYNNWRVIYNSGFRDKGSPYHGGAGSFSVENPDDEPLLGETSRVFRSTGNGGADGVPIRNRLSGWIGRKMNIPYLNSHYMQLYRNGGQFDNLLQDEEYPGKGYSKNWFPDGSNGDVYKIAVWFEFQDDNSSFSAAGATLDSLKSGSNYKLARYRYNWQTRGYFGSNNNYTNIYNLVTAGNDTSTNFVPNLQNLVDIEEWMRVFAYDRVLGNWDSWTYNVGQNMFAIKQAGLPWQLMPWDIDFTLGAGDGPTTSLFVNNEDGVMNNWFNNPAIRRSFWRAYEKALEAALDPAQYTPIGDALQASVVRNNISGITGPSSLYSFMAQRRSYIISQLQANDVASFTITRNNGANYTSTTPTTVLTGKAPFAVVNVAVNGTPYQTVWSDQNTWAINVPLSTGANVLTVTGVDIKGALVAGNTASITVTYSGAAQLPQDYVVINEVHYHPAEPKASFIELYNSSTTTPFDLSGMRVDGLGGLTLPAGSVIPAGGYSLLVGDRANFALAYGQTIPVLAEFPGTLDNGGESIALVKPLGQGGTNDLIISDVHYSSSLPWPTNANGFGPSLQLIDASKGSYRVANWATTASNTDPNRVTPGRANSVKATIAAFPTLWINEVLPNSLTGPLDNAGEREPFIEIYNSGTASVSLNGLYLSDDYTNLQKWAFPSTATLGAKQFLVVWADGQPGQSTASSFHTSFRLNPTNGSVALSRVQTTAVAIDYIDYARIAPDHSIGSYPDGEPRNRRLFSNVTGGASNDPTMPTANIVINEYMAANTTTIVDPATSNFEDWFELYNAGSNDIDLTSYKLTSILTNSTQFQIPSGYVLPAGGFLLVWADNMSKSNQVGDASLHVSFKLNKLGGDIGLFDPDGKLIDGFSYGEQTNDVSMGHFPDGDTGLQVTFDAPTPGGPNTLSGANQPPVFTAISDQTVTEQTQLQLTAHATDPDAGQTLQYSLGAGSPAGAAIDANTGVFTWTPTEQQGPGAYQVTVLATDNGTPARTALVRFNVTVNESNQAPILDPISNATIPDSVQFAFTATASDPDVPANSLTFSLGNGAPAGAAIDPVTGRFTWTPTPAQAGNYNVTIVVTDNGSPVKSDQKTFSVTVNVVEHAPVIDQVSQQFVNEGSPFQLQIHATDLNSPPSAMTYSLEGVGLPTGLAIDPSTGVITWTPTEAQGPNNYGVNVRATKNSGSHLSSTITFSITVNEVNQAPVLGSIQNIQVEEGGFASLQIGAVDADLPKQNLTYSLLPGAPAGASIDTVSGLFTWQTPLDGAALTNQIFVVVTDDGPGALSNTNSFFVTLIPRFRAVINEIMYHPTVANAEYIELINPSTVRTQDLTGVILGGPRMNYAFTSGTKLLPGQIITIAQNTTAFHTGYGAGVAVAGQWTGSFDRTDAWVRLYSVDAQNHTNVLDQVNFEPNAPWNTAADDGAGSLQVIDPLVDNSRVGNWTAVPANPGPQWQHVIQTGTASSSTLYLYLETVGDVYLDDVVLVAGDVAEVGQNFVADGDFESALTGPWGVSPNLSGSSLSSTIKHSGASSLHMVTTAGGTTRASAIYQDFATALTTGANYTLSYWYLPNTNGGTLTLRLSGSGIKSTIDITPTTQNLVRVTPDATNNVTATLAEFPSIWINEVLPNNVTGFTDNQGQHDPWLELFNSGATPIDLTGWYLTTNYANLAGWQFPNGATVPAGGFLVIFADGQPGDTTVAQPHTSFRLQASGGSLALVRPQTTGLAVVDYVNFGTTAADTSIASIPDGQAFTRQTTTVPTPGAFNSSTPNRSPVITNPGAKSVQAGQALSFIVVASDPDQPTQSITYSLDTAPAGASVGASSGLFTWTPTAAQVGNNPVTVRVTDNGVPSLSATATFNVNVTANNSPSIVNPGNKSAQYGQLVSFTVSGSDPDSQQTLTYSLDIAPQGATINGTTGAFTWTPTSGQVGTNALRVRVTDNGLPPLSATADFNIVVTTPNQTPIVVNPGAKSVQTGNLLAFNVSGSDPDAGQTLTYSLDIAPQGAAINATSGAFTWTPGAANVGTNPIRVRVTDNGVPNLFATADFNITVTSNNPPTVANPGTQNVQAGRLLSFTVTGSDPDAGQTIAYSLDTAPQGAAINAASGAFTWTPTAAQVGTNAVRVRVTDNGVPNLFTTADFNIIVASNRPPTVVNPGTKSTLTGQLLSFTVSGSDPDAGQTVTYTLDVAPTGATINSATGAFTWTPTTAQAGTNALRVRVTDNGTPNLFVTADFNVVVTKPNQTPSVVNPGTQNVQAGRLLSLTVSGNDPDAGQTLAFSLDTAPTGAAINATSGAFTWTPTAGQVGTNAVRVRVTDNGSPALFATADFNIIVASNRPPVIVNPGSKTNAVGQLLSFTVSASDPDAGQTLTFSLDTPPAGAAINGTTGAFTWTPTAGQVGTNVLHLRVTDNGTPALSATADFNVIVTGNQSGSITLTGSIDTSNHPGIGFTAQSGVTYRVEYKNQLTDPTWILLQQITGQGVPVSITDPNPGQVRFYHVVAP